MAFDPATVTYPDGAPTVAYCGCSAWPSTSAADRPAETPLERRVRRPDHALTPSSKRDRLPQHGADYLRSWRRSVTVSTEIQHSSVPQDVRHGSRGVPPPVTESSTGRRLRVHRPAMINDSVAGGESTPSTGDAAVHRRSNSGPEPIRDLPSARLYLGRRARPSATYLLDQLDRAVHVDRP
jgi:hypothetical protein